MKNFAKRAYVAITGLCLCIGMTACGSSGEDTSTPDDTSVTYNKTLVPDAEILDVREGFSDVVIFCDGANRVYMVEGANAIYVVQNDAHCGGAQ
jgi:hypothetical protein